MSDTDRATQPASAAPTTPAPCDEDFVVLDGGLYAAQRAEGRRMIALATELREELNR